MATINFPNSPSINDIYTDNGKSWLWNGSGWQAYSSSLSLATAATNIVISTTDGNGNDSSLYPVFVGNAATGNQLPHIDSGAISYNASTDTLTAANFAGTATNATNVIMASTTSTDTTTSVVLVGNQNTTAQTPFIDSGITYNANTDALSVSGSIATVSNSLLQTGTTTELGNISAQTATITSTAATAIFTDTVAYSTSEYIIQAKVGSNYRSSKIMLFATASASNFSEYAIVENSANSIPVTFSTSVTSNVVTLRGAFTGWTAGNNITVKVIRIGIV